MWLAEGVLDVVVPMAYTTDTEEFKGWVALTMAGASGRVWAGLEHTATRQVGP